MAQSQPLARPTLTVGLVNNMPASAVAATERQFGTLLAAAFPARDVILRRLTCLDPLSHPPARDCPDPYFALDDGGLPDALVVTGAEPVAGSLSEEPIWPGVTWIADWAAAQGVPVIWSCLAGHAAVRHLDGIERSRLPAKLSGLFPTRLAGGLDRVTAGLPPGIAMPQSRYHGLPERLLERAGYEVLAYSAETGADGFTKRAGADFLFLQGHPEYDADTLLREYRRDMRRYLAGERNAMPAIPQRYFDPATEHALEALSARAAACRDAAQPAELHAILAGATVAAPWRAPAARLIGAWLSNAAGRAFHARTGSRAGRQSAMLRSAAA